MMMLATCVPAQSELLHFTKSSINRVAQYFLPHMHAASPRSTLVYIRQIHITLLNNLPTSLSCTFPNMLRKTTMT